MYITAVERAFGMDIDYGQIIKVPRAARSRPLQPCGVRRGRAGEPDPHLISTSYIERQNLTMRMSMRRFTRLTNAFSKKVENLAAAVSLHFLHCTFARVHQSLSDPYPQDPGHGRRHRGSRLVAGWIALSGSRNAGTRDCFHPVSTLAGLPALARQIHLAAPWQEPSS
jgi:hypothetical protein